MNLKVTKKQSNSTMCFVCGFNNNIGLKARFYELEDKSVCALVTFKDIHQSYPNRVHGGLASAILDETIGRAMMPYSGEEIWGVTMSLTTKFKKPIPLNEEVRIIGKITYTNGRVFEGSGTILLKNDVVAVTANGTYMQLNADKISSLDPNNEDDWKVTEDENDPKEILVP